MKVRCSVCKEYFPKDEIRYNLALGNICSAECLKDRDTKAKASKPQVKDDIPPAIREACYLRDKYRCRVCGTNRGLHLHHIVYRSGGGKHTEENLITLCNTHHDMVHSDKNEYQEILQEIIALEREGQHWSYTRVARRVAQMRRERESVANDRTDSDGSAVADG